MKKNLIALIIFNSLFFFYVGFRAHNWFGGGKKTALSNGVENLNGCFPSEQINKAGCAFCDIITGKKEQEKIIAQNDLAMALQKDMPADEPVNFLIVPKKYIENLKFMDFNKEEDQKILIDMFKLLQQLWQQGSKINNNSGDFSLQINNGPCPVGSISHLHMKVQSPDNTWWK